MTGFLAVAAAIDVRVTDVPESGRDWVDYAMLAFTFLVAVGTIGAVFVALWQSIVGRRRVARLRTGLTTDGMGVYVTNDGARPFTVDSVSFRAANGAAMFPVPLAESRDVLPAFLTEGETAQLVFEHRQGPIPPEDRRPELVVVRSAAGDEWTCFYNPFDNLRGSRRVWARFLGQVAATALRRVGGQP